MELTTTYLGMSLRTPLVPSASPLSEDLDNIKRMEDAGASAVVLPSLFEEQLSHLQHNLYWVNDEEKKQTDPGTPFPTQSDYRMGAHEYLEYIRKSKESVSIPVIASLNGTSIGGWTEYAKQMQQAGADALELNIYSVPTDLFTAGSQIERTCIEIVEEVRSVITIPLAVKLSPYYSNTANMAYRLERAGADALVLFNRFYQPDINLTSMKVTPRILLSTPQTMRLPLRWIAILYGRVHTDLAATGGIHEARDVAKMLMAGASITMLCSVLLRRGIDYIRLLEGELKWWMEEHHFESLEEMQGTMCQERYADPSAFERAHYIRTLRSYKHTKPIEMA
jgi:dihydroorotate dehydrogenase (fumarate)